MIFWYLSLSVSIILLLISSFYCLRFAMLLLKIQDTVQDSVDIIEDKHEKITEILSRPLFFDSPEVRQVLKDIESVRESLIVIAKDLSEDFDKEQES